jgi:hypothetical protein
MLQCCSRVFLPTHPELNTASELNGFLSSLAVWEGNWTSSCENLSLKTGLHRAMSCLMHYLKRSIYVSIDKFAMLCEFFLLKKKAVNFAQIW